MQARMHMVGENNDFKKDTEKALSEEWGQTPTLSRPTDVLSTRC